MAFGGFESRTNPPPMSEINTTPLVDVMLVLLVIFIITAPLLTHAIRLDLPDAQAPRVVEQPETVTLSIDREGVVFWNNEAVGPGTPELQRRLAALAGKTDQPEIHLRADRETRYQRIAEVMSAAQQAGIERIGFVTEPLPIAGKSPAAPVSAKPK